MSENVVEEYERGIDLEPGRPARLADIVPRGTYVTRAESYKLSGLDTSVPQPDDGALYALPPLPRLRGGQYRCDWCLRVRTGQRHVFTYTKSQRPIFSYTPPKDWITLNYVRSGPGGPTRVEQGYCGPVCRAVAQRYRDRLAQMVEALGWVTRQRGVPPGIATVLERFFHKLYEVT